MSRPSPTAVVSETVQGLLSMVWLVAALVAGGNLAVAAFQLSQSELDRAVEELPDEQGLWFVTARGSTRSPTSHTSRRALGRLAPRIAACGLPQDAVLNARIEKGRLGSSEQIPLAHHTVDPSDRCVTEALSTLRMPAQASRGDRYVAILHLPVAELQPEPPMKSTPMHCNTGEEPFGSGVDLAESDALALWREWSGRLACPSAEPSVRVEMRRFTHERNFDVWPDVPCVQEAVARHQVDLLDEVRDILPQGEELQRIVCSFQLVLPTEVL